MTTRGKRATAKGGRTSSKASAKRRTNVEAHAGPSGAEQLSPVAARPSRVARAQVDARLTEVDTVCAAWADIVAERMAADQTFADLVDQLRHASRDLRGLFLWDAMQAAESHVALINDVLAKHIAERRADPVAILEELRTRQLRVAAVYAVNAFLAVLNQMKQEKPKWLALEGELDPRFAVLALAHQTLGYALEAARVEAPPDVTEQILAATQDETVWVWRRMPEPGTDTLAACAAAAAFFRLLGSSVLTGTDEVAALYGEHARLRG